MKRSLIVVALAATAALPALAQQANYCSRSGYVEGVVSDRDNTPTCTPRAGAGTAAPQTAQTRRDYNRNYQAQQQPQQQQQRYYGQRTYEQRNYDQRAYDQRYYDQRNYDSRYMGNRDRDWDRYRGEGQYYYGARGPEWRRGAHIPREYMARQYWVDDWRAHRLAPPPRGYQWVQVGSDYVLVALASGIIAQLMLGQ